MAFLCLCFNAAADSTRISALVTLTNAPTTAGQSLTVNSATRIWTNNPALNPATYIRTNATIGGSMTNLSSHLAQYPFATTITETKSGTNAIRLQAALDQALTVTASGGWASVTYSTQLVTTPFTVPVRVPLDVEVSSNRTTIAELLLKGLNDYSTSRALTNWSLAGPFNFLGGMGLHGSSKTSSYTLTTNDLYIGADTRSNTNLILTLPSAATASNLFFLIKDEGGAGATNTLKIFPTTGDRIDGLTNLVVSNNYGGVMLRARGGTNYAIIAAGGGVTGGVASSGGGVPLTNSVWVAKNGNDGTGARGDASKAFLTLGAAKTAAVSGDTIFVMPGTYDEKDLLKNGVNWHFFNGAKVTYTGAGNGSIFDDGSDGANTNVTSTITGDGQFANNGSAQYYVLYSENDSNIRFHGLSATSDDYVMRIAGGTSAITIEDMEINGTSRNPILVNDGLATLTLNRCKLVMTDTDNNGAALYFFSANTNSVLRDCVLIGNLSAGSPVSILGGLSGTQVRIYGSLMSNLTNDTTNVGILTGASRFEVSTDVQ